MAFNQFKGAVEGSDIVSDVPVARLSLLKLNAVTAPDGDVALNSQKITGLANPAADQDAATKKYVDDNFLSSSDASSTYLTQSNAASTYLTQSSASSLYVTSSSLSSYATQSYVQQQIEGIDPKEICRVASTADFGSSGGWSFSSGTLSKSGSSLSIDGVTLTSGDRVLVKDQSTAAENGLYAFTPGGGSLYLIRATDADTVDGLKNAYTFILEGTANAGKGFVQTTLTGSGTINTDDVGFTQFTSAASTLTQEQVEDYAGALVATGGTKTGITVTYDDANGDMDFVVSDLNVAGDSGSTGMTPGDTLTIAGGTNVTTAMSGDTLTITASDTNTQLSQEEVEDYAAGLITGASHTGISASYDDSAGTLALSATINPSSIGTYAVTSGNISQYGITSVLGTADEIDVSTSSGQATLSLPDIKKISVYSGFLNADHTITRSNQKAMYVYTVATSDRTLTLPQVGGQYAPIGSSISVKLLSVGSGLKLTIASNGSDKIDGSTADVEMNQDDMLLEFVAYAASGDSTTTWILK